jgi:3-oxoacyl-(acyl-carrier-protein) synthase/acyl carrier protein
VSRLQGQPTIAMHLFSSISALLGNKGQANYSAANNMLDAIADNFQLAGINAISVQWGPWSGAGMAVESQMLLKRLHRQGLGAVSPRQGMAVMAAILLQHGRFGSLVAASPLIWKNLSTYQPSNFFDAIIPSEKLGATHGRQQVTIHARVTSKFNEELILRKVLDIAKEIVGSEVTEAQPLMEAGLDSLGAVELRNALSMAFEFELPATAAFDYPTPKSLAVFLAKALQGREAPSRDVSRPDDAPFDRSSRARFGSPSQSSGAQSHMEVQEAVMAIAAEALGRPLAKHEPFMEAGLDSLASVDLRNMLSARFSIVIPATAVFDYPTADALARFIAGSMAPDGDALIVASDFSMGATPESSGFRTDVIGFGCIYPGCENTGLLGFFEGVADGLGLQGLIPLERWDVDAYYHPDAGPGRLNARFGAFCQGIGAFDAKYFRMSRVEATALDPQARLLLQVAAEALTAAVHCGDAASLAAVTGTYVGCMFLDYMNLWRVAFDMQHTGPVMTGNGAPYQSGRVAYAFGLQGPCNGIDTACSSSLVATHNGHRSITSGESSSALTAGVNAMLWHETTVGICQLQALSPVGRCRSFDAAADGYGRGEGFAAALLVQHGLAPNATLAVIAGSAVNQDGRSSSLTAPNGPSQQILVSTALKSGSLSASSIGMVAIHGTGTPLGDPIEVGALGGALRPSKGSQVPVSLVSVKSCYGHTEGTAGVTGMLLAMGSVEHMLHPPVVGLGNMNLYVSSALSGMSSVAVPRQCAAGSALDGANLAGTSSFGMSGVNAHSILHAAVPSSAPHIMSEAKLHWEKEYYWPALWPHALLHKFAAATLQSPAFTAFLSSERLAFIHDHLVSGREHVKRILALFTFPPLKLYCASFFPETLQFCFAGRPLLVGTSMLEFMSASGNVLSPSSSVVASSVFTLPCILSLGEAEKKFFLVCKIIQPQGTISISSSQGQHMTATVASLRDGVDRRQQGTKHFTLRNSLQPSKQASAISKKSVCYMAQPSEQAGFATHPAIADSTLHLCALTGQSFIQNASAPRIPTSNELYYSPTSSGSMSMPLESACIEVRFYPVQYLSLLLFLGALVAFQSTPLSNEGGVTW